MRADRRGASPDVFDAAPAASPPTARYEQVKDFIRGHVGAGDWPPGHRLPSESELVSRLGVSRMTVHRALRELSAEGLITRAQGVGSFVAEPARRVESLELRDIAEDIAANGHRHVTRVVTCEAVRATAELAAAFELRPGARLFHTVIIHCEGETPLQTEERWVSPLFAPDYLAQDFSSITTHRYLTSIGQAEEIEHLLRAITPDAEMCALLELPTREACLQLSRRTWVGGRVVMRGILTNPGTRYAVFSRTRPAAALR